MLAPAPYQVSAGEDKEESEEAQGGLHSGGTPGNLSGEIGTSTPEDGREGRTNIPTPHQEEEDRLRRLEKRSF